MQSFLVLARRPGDALLERLVDGKAFGKIVLYAMSQFRLRHGIQGEDLDVQLDAAGDLIAVYSTSNGDVRKQAVSTVLDYFQENL